MEIFELRYFLEVARHENIHRASQRLNVSPASLSKAIGRLEVELGTQLFNRVGRHIHLTDQGQLLKIRATQILQLEENARQELSGRPGHIQAVIAGPEVLLGNWGLKISMELRKRFPDTTFEYHTCDEEKALQAVENGNAHLALVTKEIPTGLSSKTLGEAKFVTVVGHGHPLYSQAKNKKTVTVEEILQHSFVSPSRPILGRVGVKQSLDGWRDDQFTRRVQYLTTSLNLLASLLTEGHALAYLPDYYAQQLPVLALKVSGCPYTCTQKIRLVARRPQDTAWIKHLF